MVAHRILGGEEGRDGGDHARATREVELAAGDAAIGQHVLAELAGELGLPPLDVGMEEALEERAEEVGVADEDDGLVWGVMDLVDELLDALAHLRNRDEFGIGIARNGDKFGMHLGLGLRLGLGVGLGLEFPSGRFGFGFGIGLGIGI